jgi:hypothetical protein
MWSTGVVGHPRNIRLRANSSQSVQPIDANRARLVHERN